jgi:hypothetical protein
MSRPEVRLTPGDVVFNDTNSPELVGKTALFDDDAPAFSNHMTRLRVNPDELDPGYLLSDFFDIMRDTSKPSASPILMPRMSVDSSRYLSAIAVNKSDTTLGLSADTTHPLGIR